MPEELDRPGPEELRVSHEERDRVAELLREAAGEGRIDLDELEERLAATYEARTRADLASPTRDLPARADPTPVDAGPQRRRHLAILSGLDRRGTWVVPREMTVFVLMGGATLDLRLARFAAQEVVLTINAIMGGASVVVSPSANVVIEGTGVMGGFSGPSGLVAARPDDSSPTVRIRGVAFCGGVSVERKHVPST